MARLSPGALEDDEDQPLSEFRDVEAVAATGPSECKAADEWGFGTRLEEFEIREFLGKGGMGRVYKAFDHSLKRVVAIKSASFAVAQDERLAELFLQEGQAQAKVEDPRVARVYCSKRLGGIPCHVMEYVPGEPLCEVISRERRLTPQRAVFIVREVADGLRSVHLSSLVHGDIKPRNVMISGRSVKIIDFGVSRELSRPGRTREVKGGTAGYQAPEATDGRASGVSEDIYGLGCLLFECLTGQKPSSGANLPKGTRDQHEVDCRVAGIPRSLRPLLKCLLAPGPQARPESAKEVCERLDQWRERTRNRRVAVLWLALLVVIGGGWATGIGSSANSIARLSSDGRLLARHSDLDAAIASLREGEVLELRSPGPFRWLTGSTPHELEIRAALGVVPVIEMPAADTAASPLACDGGLFLRGVELRCSAARLQAGGVSVANPRSSLRIKDCRIVMEAARGGGPLAMFDVAGAETATVENCQIFGAGRVAIRWRPPARGRLTVSNCLLVCQTAIEYLRGETADTEPQLRCERCTMCVEQVFAMRPGTIAGETMARKGRCVLRFTENVVRTEHGLAVFRDWSAGPQSGEQAARVMAAVIQWHEADNLYVKESDRHVWWRSKGGDMKFDGGRVTAWSRHWDLDVKDFDALVAIGGNEETFFKIGPLRDDVGNLLDTFHGAKVKLVGLGFGTTVLASHGWLHGRRATIHEQRADFLRENGAEVVTDQSFVEAEAVLTVRYPTEIAALFAFLPARPKIAVLMAGNGFWGPDFESLSGNSAVRLLCISDRSELAKPDPKGQGTAHTPDVVLPLHKRVRRLTGASAYQGWLEAPPAADSPNFANARTYAVERWIAAPSDLPVPGFDWRNSGPGQPSPPR